MNNLTNANTGGQGIARAKISDPVTSHLAARYITTANVVSKINIIVDILERWEEIARHAEYGTGYRSKSIANICQVYAEEKNLEVWVYGTLGTCVHYAVEAGCIRVVGKERHHQSHQLQEVYLEFPPEVRAINLAAWIVEQDNITDGARKKAAAKRKRTAKKRADARNKAEIENEDWSPSCDPMGNPY
jgi:hypothetical protein